MAGENYMISMTDNFNAIAKKPQISVLQDTEGFLTCQAAF
jgi:hypothetical protein